jgi:hypothetical protein
MGMTNNGLELLNNGPELWGGLAWELDARTKKGKICWDVRVFDEARPGLAQHFPKLAAHITRHRDTPGVTDRGVGWSYHEGNAARLKDYYCHCWEADSEEAMADLFAKYSDMSVIWQEMKEKTSTRN